MPRSDERRQAHANVTAQQWVFNLLQPHWADDRRDRRVGHSAGSEPRQLCRPVNAEYRCAHCTSQTENYKHPIFVLVKGTKVSDANGGKFKITQICYGDARRALN